jgi:hypothetical protein
MKKLNSLAVFLFFLTPPIYSQTSENSFTTPILKHHSVYAELGGNSGIYSLNYDYTLSTSEKTQIAFGSGFGYYSFHPDDLFSGGRNTTYYLTPSMNFLYGKNSHHLEAGISVLLIGAAIPSVRFGYRYQPVKGGFLFRIAFTPLLIGGMPVPWGGLSFGYTL